MFRYDPYSPTRAIDGGGKEIGRPWRLSFTWRLLRDDSHRAIGPGSARAGPLRLCLLHHTGRSGSVADRRTRVVVRRRSRAAITVTTCTSQEARSPFSSSWSWQQLKAFSQSLLSGLSTSAFLLPTLPRSFFRISVMCSVIMHAS